MTTDPTAGPVRGRPCDHASVGVLISSPTGFLMFERATPPAGIAPVAGHLDHHGTPEQAAHAEATEEVGLTVTHLNLVLNEWRPNRCRRTPTREVGHHWWVFHAQATGNLNPSPREVHAPRWLRPEQLQHHAQRTADHAAGRINRHDFEQHPGLEPVWVRFLHTLRLITLPRADLENIDALV